MTDLAKIMIIAGVLLALGGICLYAIGKIPGVAKLPGDIFIKRENVTFYFPLMTCLLISLLMSLLFFLWGKR